MGRSHGILMLDICLTRCAMKLGLCPYIYMRLMLVNLRVGGGKWISIQSSLNLLVGVKPGDVRIGPLVVSGLIAGSGQELVPKTSRFQVCFCCFWDGMVGYCCGFHMHWKEIVNKCLILCFCSYWGGTVEYCYEQYIH